MWFAALQAALSKIVVGDPRVDGVRMGPLGQPGATRRRPWRASPSCAARADLGRGETPRRFDLTEQKCRRRGAFVTPLLLLCNDSKAARAIHEVEAFGPRRHGAAL